jgi:hypothetical protein
MAAGQQDPREAEMERDQWFLSLTMAAFAATLLLEETYFGSPSLALSQLALILISLHTLLGPAYWDVRDPVAAGVKNALTVMGCRRDQENAAMLAHRR